MLPRLARHSILAALMSGALVVPASAQSITPVDPAELPPLWRVTGPRSRMHHDATAPLAPFVTTSLPEDAAWEGFLTPANRGSSGVFVEYQGKLVLTSAGIAGSVLTHGLVMWDGTKFESLPAVVGSVSALGVWNDHLIAATQHYPPSRFAILQLNGAVWDTLGTANSYIEKFGEFQGHLIAGGRFTVVNGVSCSLVAAFDGSSWSNAGTGISGTKVTGLTVHLDKLVAGGNITPAQGVVSLDALGGSWQPVGTGFGSGVNHVLSDGVDLYASGNISSSFSIPLGKLMRWNGTVWSGTGSGTIWDVPNVYMTRWNGKVVVSTPVPTGAVGVLAQWDGTALTPIPGDSLRGQVPRGIGTWGTKLVVTGPPLNGSVPIPSIATFDGAQWGTVQEAWRPGMFGTMRPLNDMRSWGGKLIVTGTFAVVAEQDHWMLCPFIAAWDGTHWSQLGGGAYGSYLVLGEYAGDLIVAGYSMSVPGLPSSGAARWNGVSWSALGTGPPGVLDYYSIAEFQNQLYLGAAPGLWYWSNSVWSTVPALDNQYVFAIAPSGPRLVVGGWFAQGGAIGSPNVVFWDGTTLQAAGPGVNDVVYTATEWLGQPVIGGRFTASGATLLPGVAIWDGSQWQPMGTRAVEVDQLRVQDGELFASGDFRLPDDSVVETIAHWTGTDWHVLGSGSNGYAFATYGGYLYQAGSGLVHGHMSHGPSRVPLTAVLDAPRSQTAARIALSVSPNPARGLAGFSFTLASAGHARVTVLDLAGRRVATLADGAFEAGPHRAAWTTPGAPGVYLALLETGAGRVARRFVMLER